MEKRGKDGAPVRAGLVWTVRLGASAGWVSTAVACVWLLGATAMVRPWVQPFVWGAVAVGCAVVRLVALWRLRGAVPDDEFSDEFWVKGRTGLLWLLVAFVSGAMFVALLTSSNSGEKLDSLREAGAEVSTATVVERGSVREELSDDVVKGYASRLVVSVPVPGGAERLTVRGAYTYEKPGKGTEVDVLWARSDPGLGGYVNETKDLDTLAVNRWKAFQDDELGNAALFSFVLVMFVWLFLGAVFTFSPDHGEVQKLAWSAPFQTVRTALTAAMFWGWAPILLGHEPNVPQMLCAAGGFVLVPLTYLGTSIRGFN
ncbi:hypothetical protein [Streptomyces sp. NPDC046909]|uniref:hypothetical protein n=1 Tax=Streptomyces sp. NPDC046909 TaxID=3155617 RepID=UPI003403EEA5